RATCRTSASWRRRCRSIGSERGEARSYVSRPSEARAGTQGLRTAAPILCFAILTLGPGSPSARRRRLAPVARDTKVGFASPDFKQPNWFPRREAPEL